MKQTKKKHAVSHTQKKYTAWLSVFLLLASALYVFPPRFAAPVVAEAQTVSIGETVTFGGREWRVLEKDGDHALLLHETVIINQPYHHTWQEITWENSSSRAWLNGEFLNSFNEEDRARIRETNVINNDNPWTFSDWTGHFDRTPGGNNTADKIFLLSIEEVTKYFGGSELLESGKTESNRNGQNGLRYDGIWENNSISQSRIAYNADGAASWWWLRSPGRDSYLAAYVHGDGGLGVYGYTILDSSAGGVLRPALWVNLNSFPHPNQISSSQGTVLLADAETAVTTAILALGDADGFLPDDTNLSAVQSAAQNALAAFDSPVPISQVFSLSIENNILVGTITFSIAAENLSDSSEPIFRAVLTFEKMRLGLSLAIAQYLLNTTRESETGTNIPNSEFWATPQVRQNFRTAIENAQAVYELIN